MILWAEDNLEDDEIEGFNLAMDSLDPQTMLNWIAALYEAYMDEDEEEEYSYDY